MAVIGTSGSFVASFSIDGIEDFIKTEDLLEFSIEEQAGNRVPMFHLVFNTRNDRIFAFLNEGNPISLSLGRTETDSLTTRLVCTELKTTAPSGDNSQMIEATGLYDAVSYWNGSRMKIFPNKKSVEVLAEIAKEHFNTDIDSEFDDEDVLPGFSEIRTVDQMNWIQPFMNNRDMVHHTWLRSYMPDSFLGMGIDSFGQFIVKDMKSDRGRPQWIFSKSFSGDDRDIIYDSDYEIQGNSGIINSLIGYGSRMTVSKIENSSETLVTELTSPILALTDSLDKKADIEPNQFSSKMQSSVNVHNNYYRAMKKNKANLGQFSNVRLRLSFSQSFVPIRILDLAHFSTQKIANSEGEESSEYLSGLYFVSGVTRRIQNNQLLTMVDICRESFNQLEGDLVDPDLVLEEPSSELTEEALASAGLDQEEPE